MEKKQWKVYYIGRITPFRGIRTVHALNREQALMTANIKYPFVEIYKLEEL